MTTDYISSKAPLIYYSFSQVRTKDSENIELHAANKITIRKHNDFDTNGLEFLVYNCALSAKPELCDGIRYTTIEHDESRRVDFYGKGVSGNGVPLNNRMGVFEYHDDMPEVAFARTDMKNIYSYHNFYKPYDTGHDIFAINKSSVQEFIASTGSKLQGQSYDPLGNTWYAIRAFVLNYYSKQYGMSQHEFRGVSTEEWSKKESAVNLLDRCSLLKQLESLCDEKVFDAYQDYRNGNEMTFKRKLEGMVSLLATYYILYRTFESETNIIPSKDLLRTLIKSLKNEAFQYPLLFAWEKYKYGAHWDFWEEGHSMFEYMMFEIRIKEHLPKLIKALEVQKGYFHPKYKEIIAIYSKLRQDLDDGTINV